jgi:hypothetical protein
VTEQMIFPSTIYELGSLPREVPNKDYIDFIINGRIGAPIVIWAAIPATGRIVYLVTRVTSAGVFGEVIEDTIERKREDIQ